MGDSLDGRYREAADIIIASERTAVFTGAGISVESGIPTFRGKGGLWDKYDPGFLDISLFNRDSRHSWRLIKEIFYDYFGQAVPNMAHYVLAEMESAGLVETVITQNIDNLHQAAGSAHVVEFHGTLKTLKCMNCGLSCEAGPAVEKGIPPLCSRCGSVLKPDFVFFGEPVPERAATEAFEEADKCRVMIVIGTTGEVMPASMVPRMADRQGAVIIEINTELSEYTASIADIFLQGKASEVLAGLMSEIRKNRKIP